MSRTTLIEAADQVGEACATLARYRSLLAGAGSVHAPAVAHAITDIRRAVVSLDCIAVSLANARRVEAAA